MDYTMAVLDHDEVYLELFLDLVDKFNLASENQFKVKEYRKFTDVFCDLDNQVCCEIYFVNVDLPGYDWKTLIKRIKESTNALIVFISAKYSYIIDGYQLEVFRYMPKDETRTKLFSVLADANVKLSMQSERHVIIKTPKVASKICLDDIVYIYKEEKNCVFVLNTRNEFLKVRKTLSDVYELISSDEFLFADRCYIVNMWYIRYIKIPESSLILKNGERLVISKNKIQEAAKKIYSYWSLNGKPPIIID